MRHAWRMAYAPGYTDPVPTPPQPVAPGRRGAPLGVRIVAVLQYLTGAVALLAVPMIVLVKYGDGAVGGRPLPETVRSAVYGWGLPSAALALVVGVLSLAIGLRLHRGKQWARVFTIGLSGLSLALNIWSLVSTGSADPLTGLVLPTLYLGLLNTPAARDWFRYRRY